MAPTIDERIAAIAEDARIARENTEEILRMLRPGEPPEEPASGRREGALQHPISGTGPTGRGMGHRH